MLEGINGSLLFDDSYNSSPMAAEAAIEVLSEYPAQRRIAVLGDMKELGEFSRSEHERIGGNIESQKCLVFVYCRTKGEIYRRRSEKEADLTLSKFLSFPIH